MNKLTVVRSAFLLAVSLLLVAGGSTRTVDRAEATFPGAVGRLAYTIDDEIYVSAANGDNAVNVTNDPANDFDPVWSPDGTRIAFTSERDNGNREIYVMDDDGSNPTRLTTDTSQDFQPAWSPDGSTIIYRRSGELYTIASTGGTPAPLPVDTNGSGPEYSPAGTRITYSSPHDGDYEIYTANADGSNAQQLTHNTVPDFEPNWSPDGTMIVFQREKADPEHDGDLWSINVNGSNERVLTEDADNYDGEPVWSPDGTTITFSRTGAIEGLFSVAEGGTPQLLLQNAFSPAWESLLPADLLQGDIDCDGDVDAVDGAHLVAFAAEVSFDHEAGCPAVGSSVASLFGDLDCYGTIDLLDALAIFRYLVGVIVNQNELCPAINTPLAH